MPIRKRWSWPRPPLQAVSSSACRNVSWTLAQAVTYIATAPKSNASTLAIGQAREDVRSGRTLPVPKHLRDAHYRGAKQLGHGEGYQYSHDSPWAGRRRRTCRKSGAITSRSIAVTRP